MADGNALPPRDHNNPPPFDQEQVDALAAEAAQFLDAAGEWIEAAPIASQDQAAKLNDFIAGCKAARKRVDEARKEAKRPHDEAGKAVQAAFKPVLEKLEKSAERVQPMLTAFMEEQEAKRREEARRVEEEARKAREEAEAAAARAAARNDISGEVDAEAAQEQAAERAKEAERLAKARANVSSATGGGRTAALRTYVRAEVSNLRVAVMTFADDPELREVLVRLAERRARAKGFDAETDTIPGFNLKIERKAV